MALTETAPGPRPARRINLAAVLGGLLVASPVVGQAIAIAFTALLLLALQLGATEWVAALIGFQSGRLFESISLVASYAFGGFFVAAFLDRDKLRNVALAAALVVAFRALAIGLIALIGSATPDLAAEARMTALRIAALLAGGAIELGIWRSLHGRATSERRAYRTAEGVEFPVSEPRRFRRSGRAWLALGRLVVGTIWAPLAIAVLGYAFTLQAAIPGVEPSLGVREAALVAASILGAGLWAGLIPLPGRRGRDAEAAGPAGLRLPGTFRLVTSWVPVLAALAAYTWMHRGELPGKLELLSRFDFGDAVNDVVLNAGFGTILWGVFAVLCESLGRRRLAPSALDRLRDDGRPPVIYLRAFNDDGRRMEEGFWYDINNALLAGGLRTATLEQALARECERVGPFVAIGRPGELLPERGAARMYVEDAHWQDLVRDLLGKAGMVVLQAGETEGLRWEMATVSRSVRPDQALLFVPFRRSRKPGRREARYATFLDRASGALEARLPGTIGDAHFLYFRDGTPWEASPVEPLGPGQAVPPDLAEHPSGELIAGLSRAEAFARRSALGRALKLPLLLFLSLILLIVATVVVNLTILDL